MGVDPITNPNRGPQVKLECSEEESGSDLEDDEEEEKRNKPWRDLALGQSDSGVMRKLVLSGAGEFELQEGGFNPFLYV